MDGKDSKEEILNSVERMATEYEQTYRGCGRCSLAALQKQFSLGNDETLKASTPLAAGVAFKGEVCGALLGGMMALGMLTASQDLSDSKAMGKAMAAGYKLYNRFVKEMGTANCFKIQEMKLGRHFNLADPKEYEDFQKAGGYAQCSKVVGQAARLAAEMILELREKEGQKSEQGLITFGERKSPKKGGINERNNCRISGKICSFPLLRQITKRGDREGEDLHDQWNRDWNVLS